MKSHFLGVDLYKIESLGVFFLIFFIFNNDSWALPSHRRLWEKKYGYSVSCTLCHNRGGGSQLSSYGEDFQRFGMSPGAFISIEKRDSDKDGSNNIDEIRAKSNPGDVLSNPVNTSDWLSRIEESMIPLDELKKIFSDIQKFSILEGTLYPDQVAEIEKKLNVKLSEADTLPTFYFAVKEQGGKLIRVGVVIFSTPILNPEKLIVGIGVDLSGKVTNVVLIKNKLNKSLSDMDFLSQYKGKSLDSELQIKKDLTPAASDLVSESEQVSETVRKSLMIISSVFMKNKKNVK